MTLTEFLLARIGEDEALAREFDGPQWSAATEQFSSWRGARVALWQPERVVAECEAKRRIVELHTAGEMLDHYEYGCVCGYRDHRWSECQGCGKHLDDEGELDRGIHNQSCPTLALLAAPYSDHPDYRAEWAPQIQARV